MDGIADSSCLIHDTRPDVGVFSCLGAIVSPFVKASGVHSTPADTEISLQQHVKSQYQGLCIDAGARVP